jgi:hypothetical protein
MNDLVWNHDPSKVEDLEKVGQLNMCFSVYRLRVMLNKDFQQ